MIVRIVAVIAALVLAGCTGPVDDAPVDVTDPSTIEKGKGAIAGLLVDDRFRPIELVAADPKTEFQFVGFLLIQETGQQIRTNADGEFVIPDLEPGRYTIRGTIDRHELTPERVNVEEGVFNEATVEARRVISDIGVVLTQEHSVYISCAMDFVYTGGNLLPCDGDLSSDSYSSTFDTNYTQYGDNATWMIFEMLGNQEKRWEVQIRATADDGGRLRYAAILDEGLYIKAVMENGVNADAYQNNPGYAATYAPWENDRPFQTIFFIDHKYREEQQALTNNEFCCGIGFSMGIKAKILQIVFLGEPERGVDPNDYCVLCE